jgi:hypothetical protein
VRRARARAEKSAVQLAKFSSNGDIIVMIQAKKRIDAMCIGINESARGRGPKMHHYHHHIYDPTPSSSRRRTGTRIQYSYQWQKP